MIVAFGIDLCAIARMRESLVKALAGAPAAVVLLERDEAATLRRNGGAA